MGQPVDVTPAGTSRIAPWIISRDTVAEIDFLGAVFGAVEQPGARIMNGDRVGHAEIDLAGMAVLMFDSGPGWAPTPAHMRVYVDDVQRTLRAATERGARVVTEPTELAFGDVVARFRDPQGHCGGSTSTSRTSTPRSSVGGSSRRPPSRRCSTSATRWSRR
jgi:uncharacterized glyoxalase superfamily protein PhnB